MEKNCRINYIKQTDEIYQLYNTVGARKLYCCRSIFKTISLYGFVNVKLSFRRFLKTLKFRGPNFCMKYRYSSTLAFYPLFEGKGTEQ